MNFVDIEYVVSVGQKIFNLSFCTTSWGLWTKIAALCDAAWLLQRPTFKPLKLIKNSNWLLMRAPHSDMRSK
jgi:hypothetical protein